MTSDQLLPEPTADEPRAEDSFLPLLVALVLMLMLAPLLKPLPFLTSTFASAAVLTGLFAALRVRSLRTLVIGAAAVCVPLRWAAEFWGGRFPSLILLSHTMLGISFALLEAVVLVRVMSHSRVTRQTVLGAICGYVLIGFMFAFVYAVLTNLSPGSLAIGGQPLGAERVTNLNQHVAELVYFSFITLATVGYGDIVPISPAARSAAILEALAGQLYLAAFVARLVGAMSVSSSERK